MVEPEEGPGGTVSVRRRKAKEGPGLRRPSTSFSHKCYYWSQGKPERICGRAEHKPTTNMDRLIKISILLFY